MHHFFSFFQEKYLAVDTGIKILAKTMRRIFKQLQVWHGYVFQDDIDAGKYLILIYAARGQGEKVKQMMRDQHPDAVHVATDRQYVNPFSVVRRKRRQKNAQTAA